MKLAGRENKTAVVVGTVTDDVRLQDIPKLKVTICCFCQSVIQFSDSDLIWFFFSNRSVLWDSPMVLAAGSWRRVVRWWLLTNWLWPLPKATAQCCCQVNEPIFTRLIIDMLHKESILTVVSTMFLCTRNALLFVWHPKEFLNKSSHWPSLWMLCDCWLCFKSALWLCSPGPRKSREVYRHFGKAPGTPHSHTKYVYLFFFFFNHK